MKNIFIPLAILFVAFITCKKDPEVEQNKDPAIDYMEYINGGAVGAGGGQIVYQGTGSFSGTSISIPAGAINVSKSISIQIDNSKRPTGDNTSDIIKFEPEGLTFEKPVTLKIPVSKTLSNPIIYYFVPDSMTLKQIPILEYNKIEGYIKAEINHFSRYYLKDNIHVFFDGWLYNTGNSIKARVLFGGNNGLQNVSVSLLSMFTSGLTIFNAKQAIDNGIPYEILTGIKHPEKLFASITVNLKGDALLTSYPIKTVKLAVQRKGIDPINEPSSVVLHQIEPAIKELFTSGDLDDQSLEDFFSGKALIFDFNIAPEAGKKYYLEISWVLANTKQANWFSSTYFTDKYEVNTFRDYPAWTTSTMINSDPDKNRNFVDDNYDVVPNQPPVSPSNPSPANNATEISISPTLSWDCSDPDGDALTFDVYFGTDNPPTTKVSTLQNSKTLSRSGLIVNTAYHWKVVALDNKGNSTEGPVWKFTTQQPSGSAPVANFSVSTTAPKVGQTLQFTDQSTNNPSSWLWNFGDGSSSTSQNTTHSYTAAGTYTVSLKVENSVGYNTKTMTITVSLSGGTNETSSFTDSRDDKTYKTVKIGDQWWMAENLAYLPSVSPSSQVSSTAPHYYVYGYQGTDPTTAKVTANFIKYGVLYNWIAAKTACPAGWHLPTDDEWKQLEMELGMTQAEADRVYSRGTDQGSKMKSTSGWKDNGNGTNSSGLTCLPGGICQSNGVSGYTYIEESGWWWSSTDYPTNINQAFSRILSDYRKTVFRSWDLKGAGFSVRCIRD